MEELLASIRKAIHDDIGEVPPASISGRTAGTLQRGTMRELHVRVGEEVASAASEIQHLRDKINRTRGPDTPPPREPVKPMPLAQALQAEAPPRRSWRDIEPPPPQAKLRSTILDLDSPPPHRADHTPRRDPPPRVEYAPRSEPEPRQFEPPRYSEPRHYAEPQQQSWAEDPPALPPPRDSSRPRAEPSAMLSGDSAQAVQSAFTKLAETMLARASGDRSLEDMTRELLRGMLKQWLDDHLPQLVERLVREEIERVARQGR